MTTLPDGPRRPRWARHTASLASTDARWFAIARTVVLGVGLLAHAAACERKKETPPVSSAVAGAGVYAPPMASAAPMMPSSAGERSATEEEAGRFSERLGEVVRGGPLTPLIDTEHLVRRALSGLSVSDAYVRNAVRGLDKSGYSALAGVIQSAVSYRALQNREVRGERRLRMRLVTADGMFVYHDYLLFTKAGQTKASDVYVSTSAEELSESIRRLIQSAGGLAEKASSERERRRVSQLVEHRVKLRYMATSWRDDPDAVLATYETLPRVLREEKSVMLLRLQASLFAKDVNHYWRAAKQYRAHFPNDASLDTLSIDFFTTAERYADALAAVARVEEKEGEDPYLDVVRARLYVMDGRPKEARAALERARKREPDLPHLDWVELLLSLSQDDVARAAQLLPAVERAGLDVSELEEDGHLTELRAHPEYEKAARR